VDDQALAAVFTGVAGSGGAQAYTVSASISAADGLTSQVRASTPPEQDVADAAKDELAVLPKQGESSQSSYALVLALIALIGLVPVSRRSE
jgi:hypothetical protein